MKIKNLKITRFNNSDGLIGFASFSLCGIELNSIRIYKTNNGISIGFPYATSNSGVKYYIIKPENEHIEEELIKEISKKINGDIENKLYPNS